AEFLSNRPAFTSLKTAQQALDEWVDYYNTARPHQSLDIATPAQRFTAAATMPSASTTAPPAADRSGDNWVSRRVCS
ncbi:integrase core domain-containing protein, partial [Mycobacterium montefiorense]